MWTPHEDGNGPQELQSHKRENSPSPGLLNDARCVVPPAA